jgi:hypothetical protein
MVGEGHSSPLDGELVGEPAPLFSRRSDANSLTRPWLLRGRRFPDRVAAHLFEIATCSFSACEPSVEFCHGYWRHGLGHGSKFVGHVRGLMSEREKGWRGPDRSEQVTSTIGPRDRVGVARVQRRM